MAVEGSLMMSEVHRIEKLVRQDRQMFFVPLLRYFEMGVQNIAMREIFDGHPERDAAAKKIHQGGERMSRARSEEDQSDRIPRINRRCFEELVPGDSFLLALVGACGASFLRASRESLIRSHYAMGPRINKTA